MDMFISILFYLFIYLFSWLKIAKLDQQFFQVYCKKIAQIIHMFFYYFKTKVR